MENFDELQNLWKQQPEVRGSSATASALIRKAESSMKRLKIGQWLTIAILSTLTVILVAYFVWSGAHLFNELTIGLGLMTSVIFIRIILEWISVQKLKQIKIDSSMIEFSTRMALFYSWRRKIHLIFIPVIYLLYTFGFTLLLPVFKEHLSRGMYLYVLISGFSSLIVLALVITRYISKEKKILNSLRNIQQP